MGEIEKKKYILMADEDRRRFHSDMAKYKPNNHGDREETQRIHGHPRKPLKALAWFCKDFLGEIPTDILDIEKCPDVVQAWASLSPSERTEYETMADKDDARYKTELEQYSRQTDEQKTNSGPKTSLSAFFWFSCDERSKVVDDLPPNASQDEVSRELERRWTNSTQAVKAIYAAQAGEDEALYEKKMC